jgi:hypothetical protein
MTVDECPNPKFSPDEARSIRRGKSLAGAVWPRRSQG